MDEAGRGPLAGPVTAAAVCLGRPGSALLDSGLLRDSKRLSALQRARAATLIEEQAEAWAIGWAWPEEIDRLNIHNATLLAMTRALAALPVSPRCVLVDGLFVPPAPVQARAVVGGDARIPAIMAASILAKTARDRWMIDYARIQPGYAFERHKGYPTRHHRERLAVLGPCPIHRRSFKLLCSS